MSVVVISTICIQLIVEALHIGLACGLFQLPKREHLARLPRILLAMTSGRFSCDALESLRRERRALGLQAPPLMTRNRPVYEKGVDA